MDQQSFMLFNETSSKPPLNISLAKQQMDICKTLERKLLLLLFNLFSEVTLKEKESLQ